MKWIERIASKAGVDIDKVKNYSLDGKKEITSLSTMARA